MADVKNFGLVGTGSNLQLGKGGARIKQTEGAFSLRSASDQSDVALTLSGLTASTGNITATAGSLVLNDATLNRQQAGVLRFAGTAAVMVPVGTQAQRPGTAASGMFRFNDDTDTMEYYNGTAWTTVATGGTAVTAVSVASANGFAGTSSGGTTPELTLKTTAQGLLTGDSTTGVISAAISGTDIKTVGGVSLVGAGDIGVIGAAYGGTGVDNTGKTITLGGNVVTAGAFTTVGAFGTTLTTTGTTSVTLPTSGTLATTANVLTVQNEIDAIETSLGTGIATDGTFVTASFTGSAAGATSFTDAINKAAAAADASVQTVTVTSNSSGVTVDTAGTSTNPTFALTLDAGLQALAVKTSTGMMVQTGDNTYASRSLVQPAAGITITDADGIAGNPTFALANDLAALEGLTTVGYMVRTGDGTATTRAMSTVSGDLVITGAADGVSTDTTFGLATVTQADSGTFSKVTLDTKGRVTGNTAVTTADITALVDSTYVNVTGDSMSGTLTMTGGATVTGLPTPVNASDAANKGYVDNAVTGLTWKNSAQVLSASNVDIASAPAAIDGITLTAGDRVLLVAQATAEQNGIYVFNGAAAAMTRSLDAATPAQLSGAAMFIQQGTYADSAWTQTIEPLVAFAAQIWVQFSGAGAYTGGTGITVSGTTIDANAGAGIAVSGFTNSIIIDLEVDKAIQFTPYQGVEGPNQQLTFLLDEGTELAPLASGLEQSGLGLKIKAAGVTNAMLANSGFTVNADSGTDTLSLGNTFEIRGTSTQGISTVVTESPAGTSAFTITAADASSSQKGVATFNTASFATTSGDVTIKTNGVSNAQLANSTFTLTGSTGSDAVALGETLAITGTGAITTAVTSNALAISVAAATTATLGVASFSATNFDVAAGAVSIKAGGVNLTTDVTGILPVANGGTGVATLVEDGVMIGNGTGTVLTSPNLTFVDNTLTIGITASLAVTGTEGSEDLEVAAAGSIFLTPGETGSVVVGPAGAGIIQSDTGSTLTVTGDTGLTLNSTTGPVTIDGVGNVDNSGLVLNSAGGFLDIISTGGIFIDTDNTADSSIEITAGGENNSINVTASSSVYLSASAGVITIQSGAGSTVMQLPAESITAKVTVVGPTAEEYSTDLADDDLTNKYYVDAAIAASVTTGNAGDVKAFQGVIDMSLSEGTSIGTMPAGSTVLSVKVNVTSAAGEGSTLVVGKASSESAYMTADENDTDAAGLYVAETFVTEALETEIIVTANSGSTGSATVVVTYQLAND